MAEQPALRPIAQILALNRGGAVFERRTWPYAAFKEGYEAGVSNLTWSLRRADGRRFVVTAGFNNPHAVVDRNAAIALMQRTASLLADVE